MIHLGLTGFPLEHSLSPKLHAAALKAAGLQGDYSLFPVRPDDKLALAALFQRLRAGEIHGLNVTIPHKQTVIEFLDDLTPAAKSIGAVNTIYPRQDKLIGDNTDAPGFSGDLYKFLGRPLRVAHGLAPINRHTALVLGAGGSARAVIYALLHDGWQVAIAARRMEPAQQIVSEFSNILLRAIDMGFSDLDLSRVDLIVNTTPVGMFPVTNASPWPEGVSLPGNAAVYDLVYSPRETLLVRQARSAGLKATAGLGTLVGQAALAFKLWTGQHIDPAVMFEAVQHTDHRSLFTEYSSLKSDP